MTRAELLGLVATAGVRRTPRHRDGAVMAFHGGASVRTAWRHGRRVCLRGTVVVAWPTARRLTGHGRRGVERGAMAARLGSHEVGRGGFRGI